MMRQELVAVTGSWLLTGILASALTAGCDVPPESRGAPATDQSSTGSVPGAGVRLVAYEQRPDGSFNAVEQVISYAEYRELHDRRRLREEQRRNGIEVAQQALSYRGWGQGFFPIAACDDNRTTWMYNRVNGWAVPESDSSTLAIGCVGAAVGGSDWTGAVDLNFATLSNPLPFGPNTWRNAMQSTWTSDTHTVFLCPPHNVFPRVCTQINPWTTTNTGTGWDLISHDTF